MDLPDIDFTTLTPEQLQALIEGANKEQLTRNNIALVERELDAKQKEYIQDDIAGHPSGLEWVQPRSESQGYPRHHVTKHDGKWWESRVAFNTCKPGNCEDWTETSAPNTDVEEPVPEGKKP